MTTALQSIIHFLTRWVMCLHRDVAVGRICGHRQGLLSVALLCITLLVPPILAEAENSPFRIGLTPVFLDDQVSFLKEWQIFLEAQLYGPVEFAQRQTYTEITEMLLDEQLDVAWICGFPYVRYQDRFRLLAVPLFKGEPLYQSYLIVSSNDIRTQDIEDLRGKLFAYSDPDSNSGYLVPRVQLLKRGIDPGTFFRKAFFTWAHQDVVVAVADGLAQGGAVDGYVWETLKQQYPSLAGRTRVVSKSEKFGFPPFVARASLSAEQFKAFQDALLLMRQSSKGRELLQKLNLDGFTAGEDQLYNGIRSAVLQLQDR